MQGSQEVDDVTDALLSASRALVGIASRSLADTSGEVTLAQYRALVVLASRGPQSAQGLATQLGVAPSTATRLCDRLVAKGLIDRDQHEADRREVHLVVSEAGAAIVAGVSRRRRREFRQIVAAMDDRDRKVLVRALESFNAAAGEVPDDDWYLGWA